MDRESKGCTNGTEQLMNWLASGLQPMTNVLKICLSFEPINIIAPVSLCGDVYRVASIASKNHHIIGKIITSDNRKVIFNIPKMGTLITENGQNHLVSPT